MKKQLRIYYFLYLILLFTGCAGPIFVHKQLPEIMPVDLIRKIQNHTSRLCTLQGNAQLLVNSEMGNFSGSLQIKAHLPDSLFTKVEGPFGVDVALMRLYADDLLFYSPWLHLAFSGTINDSLSGVLPFDMNNGNFLFHMLGLLEIPSDCLRNIDLFYTRDGQYVYNFQNGDRIWVHPKGPVVTRWEKKDDQGKLIWTWEGQRFKKTGGIRLPQTIQITMEDPKQKVTVYYTKRMINRDLKTGWSEFKLPEGVNPFAL